MAGRMSWQGGQPRQPSVYTHVVAVPPAYARVYGELTLGSDLLHLSSISMGISAIAMGAMGAMAAGGDGIYRASNPEPDDLVMNSMMSSGFYL